MVGSAEGVLQRQSGEVEVMMFGGDGKRRERKAPCFSKQGVEEIKSLSLSFCMVVLVGAPSFFFFFLAAISRMLRRGQMCKSSEESTVVLKVSWIQHRLLSLSTYNLCFSKVCMALG